MGTNRGSGRKYTKTRFPEDGEVYKDLIERSPSLSEEVPELDFARTADEQLEVYRRSSEQMIRDGRA